VIVIGVPTAPEAGFKPAMLGVVVALLLTLTGTAELVAEFPDLSVATAVRTWLPLESEVVSTGMI
jgi:hypothetical protein